MTDSDRCSACGALLIPGITSCVSCGEPVDQVRARISVFGMTLPEHIDVEALKAENRLGHEFAVRMSTARSLEYAGDIPNAIAIYEAMLTGGLQYTPPFERLAILYAKAKRIDDEERVVRKALATFSEGPSQWFIVRLAKILARRRARDSPKG